MLAGSACLEQISDRRMDFRVARESLHFSVSSVFPQEFVSAKVCRSLISVPAPNSSQHPELDMFTVTNWSVPSEEKRNETVEYVCMERER